jgi:hypothetical protein
MEELNQFDIAENQIAHVRGRFLELTQICEVDTVFDYRWTRPQLKEHLRNMTDTDTFLRGQYLDIDVEATETASVCLIDYSTHTTKHVDDEELSGIFTGFAIQKHVSRSLESIDNLSPYTCGDEEKLKRMPLDPKDDVTLDLVMRLRPLVIPEGYNPETTYFEVPVSTIEEVKFANQDHPFVADMFLFYNQVELISGNHRVAGKNIGADIISELIAYRNKNEFNNLKRPLALLIETGSVPAAFIDNWGSSHILDIPTTKRIEGQVEGFDADYDESSDTWVLSILFWPNDANPEAGPIPISLNDILKGAFQEEEVTYQPIFDLAESNFLEALDQHIDTHPLDHAGARQIADTICESWNESDSAPGKGTSVELQLDKTGRYEIALTDSSGEVLPIGYEPDGEPMMSDAIDLGEFYTLKGTIIGYTYDAPTYDEYDEMDIDDFELKAIITPQPGVFDYLGGTVVMVPLGKIKSVKLGEPHNN